MSRHEEEIDGERRFYRLRSPADGSERLRKAREDSLREDIARTERKLVFMRQELAQLRRNGEAQLPLDDQPTFAPEWPNQRAPVDRGQ